MSFTSFQGPASRSRVCFRDGAGFKRLLIGHKVDLAEGAEDTMLPVLLAFHGPGAASVGAAVVLSIWSLVPPLIA